MTYEDIVPAQTHNNKITPVKIVRHAEVRQKLNVSAAKLSDMVAKDIFPKPFIIIPNGRAVGWLEGDVDAWIVARRQAASGGAA